MNIPRVGTTFLVSGRRPSVPWIWLHQRNRPRKTNAGPSPFTWHPKETSSSAVVSKSTMPPSSSTTIVDATPNPVHTDSAPCQTPPADEKEEPSGTTWKNPNTIIPAATDPTIFKVPFEPPVSRNPRDDSVSALNTTADPSISTAPFTKADYDLFRHLTYLVHRNIGLGRKVQETEVVTVDTAVWP